MNKHDLASAKNPDAIGSLTALMRAAEEARALAIRTNTAVVVWRNGEIVRLSADELKAQESGTRTAT